MVAWRGLAGLVRGFSAGKGVSGGAPKLRLPRLDAGRLADLEREGGLRVSGGEPVREFGARLAGFTGIEPVGTPAGLQATLRGYQAEGLAWLQFLRSYHLGGILADDMGLGKTLQALAHILVEKNAGRLDHPALVVAPTSVIPNWAKGLYFPSRENISR